MPEWRRQRGGREAGSAKRLSVTTPPPPAVEIPVLPNRPEVVYRYRAEAAAVAKATLRAAASAACSLKHAQSSLFCDCSYRFQSYRLVPLRIALSLKAKMVGDLPARQTGSVIVVGCWCEKVQGCVSPRVRVRESPVTGCYMGGQAGVGHSAKASCLSLQRETGPQRENVPLDKTPSPAVMRVGRRGLTSLPWQ